MVAEWMRVVARLKSARVLGPAARHWTRTLLPDSCSYTKMVDTAGAVRRPADRIFSIRSQAR